MNRSQNILIYVLPVIITGSIYIISNEFSFRPDFDRFFEVFITAFSILIGFLFTSATILKTYSNDKIEFIKKSGGMESLHKTLHTSIYRGLAAILLSVIYFLFHSLIEDHEIIAYIVILVNIFSMVTCLMFTKLFLKILS